MQDLKILQTEIFKIRWNLEMIKYFEAGKGVQVCLYVYLKVATYANSLWFFCSYLSFLP